MATPLFPLIVGDPPLPPRPDSTMILRPSLLFSADLEVKKSKFSSSIYAFEKLLL
jgi:hypothetical protein